MGKITEIFNNREISIFLWIVLFLFWFFSQKQTRKSAISLIQAFFKLYKWYIIMIVYIIVLVVAFYKIDLWDWSLLKDTIYWIFGGAFIMFFNVNKALEKEKYFLNIFKDCFKVIIILEFLSNLYSFHIVIELISIPLMLIIGLMTALSEHNKVDKKVIKFSNTLTLIYILAVLIYSAIRIINDTDSVFTSDNLKSLLFGPVMTVLFIPFLYVVALYMAYEGFLKMKKFILKEHPDLYKYLRWQILKRCNLSIKNIRLVNKKLHIYTLIEKEQITNDLNLIFEKE